MDKQTFMFGLIEEWEVSGLSKKAFCNNKGINPSKFYYWIKIWKNAKEEVPDGFAAITCRKPETFYAQYRLKYPNGVELEVSDIGLNELAALINL
ncbi:IS66 family insertion sequence element accessory protein TnpA [Arenibacter latericius]|uniref:IS66 family insertion sequence element accessory protein TnpA n=1 Tax=Arenibacter latericius TaxID=86104 RepID=UPI0003FD2E0E|nr:hypothetical protein [Arenibacter latericius]